MNQHFAIGQRLKLHLFDASPGEFVQGSFHSYNPERTRITLTDITFYPDKIHSKNQLNFYLTEVKSIEAEKHEGELKAFIDPDVGRSLAYCKGPSHPHLSYMFKQPERGLPRSDRKQRPEYKTYQQKYEVFQTIDSIGDSFDKAVSTIMDCKTIGVAFEGVLIGRFGELCWMNICDGENTFLFDVKSIGMHEKLISILTDKDVTKILHDSRLVADCLVHKYNIKIVNFIDTQVFDLMIVRARRENCPSHASSLTDCLKRYLKVPDAVLLAPIIWEEKIKDETAKWAVRPLPEFEVEVAVQNVAFLTDLYTKMMEDYFEPIKFGSEFYQKHVVSMSDTDASKYNSMDHLTPRQLYWICRNRDNSSNNQGAKQRRPPQN